MIERRKETDRSREETGTHVRLIHICALCYYGIALAEDRKKAGDSVHLLVYPSLVTLISYLRL